jgi:Family of unknown function (DUF5684)
MLNALLFLMFQDFPATSTEPTAGQQAMALGFMILWAVLAILVIAAMWKVFVKAGEPGWAALIPIYNFLVLLKIAGKPMWWFILMLIPFVNLIIAIMVMVSLAKNFGKGVGFALGLILLPMVFYPMLAWGDARYSPQAA